MPVVGCRVLACSRAGAERESIAIGARRHRRQRGKRVPDRRWLARKDSDFDPLHPGSDPRGSSTVRERTSQRGTSRPSASEGWSTTDSEVAAEQAAEVLSAVLQTPPTTFHLMAELETRRRRFDVSRDVEEESVAGGREGDQGRSISRSATSRGSAPRRLPRPTSHPRVVGLVRPTRRHRAGGPSAGFGTGRSHGQRCTKSHRSPPRWRRDTRRIRHCHGRRSRGTAP